MTDDRSQLAEYDHTYCQSTSLDTSYSRDYSFWAKIVKGDALGKFNSCMQICKPPNGLMSDAQVLDTCHFVAKVKFVPTSSENPNFAKMDRDADLVNASCDSVPYKGQKIAAQEIPVKCTRFGRDGSFLILATSQGGAVISVPAIPPPAKPAPIPDPPQFDSADAKGQPYVATFQIVKGQVRTTPGVTCAGNTCTGTFKVPAGGVIPDVNHVDYSCGGGVNQNNDPFCAWSYHRPPGGGNVKDVAVNGDTLTWYRYYNTDKDMIETYTVRYDMPHTPTAAEVQYAKDMEEYKKQLAIDPCPWTPPPKSWLSQEWSQFWDKKH
jgi:hypothetical protein